MNLNKCNGKRVLAHKDCFGGNSCVVELRILEISPTGNFVKVQYVSDVKMWENNAEWIVVEVLDDKINVP